MFRVILEDSGERRFPVGKDHELYIHLNPDGGIPECGGDVHCACLVDDEDLEGWGSPPSQYMILRVAKE